MITYDVFPPGCCANMRDDKWKCEVRNSGWIIAKLESNKQTWESSLGFFNQVQLKIREHYGDNVSNDLIDFELLRRITIVSISEQLEAAKKELESL